MDNGGAVESDVKGHFKAFMISSNSLQQDNMSTTFYPSKQKISSILNSSLFWTKKDNNVDAGVYNGIFYFFLKHLSGPES